MNYESIILEMLTRIQALEQEVKRLTEIYENPLVNIEEFTLENLEEISSQEAKKKIGTKEIREHIKKLKKVAKNEGKESITLIANDIHKSLGLQNRMPLVCNAMKQTMGNHDRIIHTTPSGYSSTLEIKYFLKEE